MTFKHTKRIGKFYFEYFFRTDIGMTINDVYCNKNFSKKKNF